MVHGVLKLNIPANTQNKIEDMETHPAVMHALRGYVNLNKGTWKKQTENETNPPQTKTIRYEDIRFTHSKESEKVQIDEETQLGDEWLHMLERGDGMGLNKLKLRKTK